MPKCIVRENEPLHNAQRNSITLSEALISVAYALHVYTSPRRNPKRRYAPSPRAVCEVSHPPMCTPQILRLPLLYTKKLLRSTRRVPTPRLLYTWDYRYVAVCLLWGCRLCEYRRIAYAPRFYTYLRGIGAYVTRSGTLSTLDRMCN